IHRQQQPLTFARFERRRDGVEPRLAVRCWRFEYANACVAVTQRPAWILLICISRLNGIPAWRPEKWDKSGGRFVGRSFHRKRQRRIGILRRLRLGNIDVHERGGPAALAKRRARDFGASNSKRSWGCGAPRRCEFGQCSRQSRKYIVQVLPAIWLQPPPACENFVQRYKNLEESLGASFAADERTVGFGEGPGRQFQLRFFGSRVDQVIKNDYVFGPPEESLHFGGRCPSIEIILQDNHGVRASIPDGFKGCRERRTT